MAHFFPNYVEKLKAAGLGGQGPRENRIRNAARHLSWQMMLTIRYGDEFSTTIGDIHETDGFTVDSRMDIKNNAIARRLAIRVMADSALAKYKHDHANSIASNLDDYKAVIREYALASILGDQYTGRLGKFATADHAYVTFTDPRLGPGMEFIPNEP